MVTMMEARLGSKGMCHRWRQSSDRFDLDHVRRPVASCDPLLLAPHHGSIGSPISRWRRDAPPVPIAAVRPTAIKEAVTIVNFLSLHHETPTR